MRESVPFQLFHAENHADHENVIGLPAMLSKDQRDRRVKDYPAD